jgi:delta-aminolevulinic acid dehydratase/porphobilinogen synthase
VCQASHRDVLAQLRERTLPIAAYQVSSEYATIKFAGGADLILSYFERDVIREGF